MATPTPPHAPPSSSLPAFLTHFLAGGAAGAAIELTLYPLDTVKTCLQANAPVPPLRQLYRGLLPNVLGAFPSTALFIVVYEEAKARQAPLPLAAASAALAASAIRVPTEVVKQNLQTNRYNTRSVASTLRRIVAARGVAGGLFAGYASFLARELPFDTIEFASYESMQRAWRAAGHADATLATTAFGTVAGAFTGFVTTPLDVIKTRQMTGATTSIAGTARAIVRDGGSAALFKGWQPRCLWIALGGGVFFTALEESRRGARRALAALGVPA